MSGTLAYKSSNDVCPSICGRGSSQTACLPPVEVAGASNSVQILVSQLSSRARQVLIYARKPLAVQNRTPALGLKTQNKAGASAERFLG
jgi:hypothetical protein